VTQAITIEISTFFIVLFIVSYLLGHKDTKKMAENKINKDFLEQELVILRIYVYLCIR